MKASDQFHDRAFLLSGKELPVRIRGWVGPRASLAAMERYKFLAPVGNRPPAVLPVAILTELSRLHIGLTDLITK
jgi:hypothetical protein